MTFVSKVQSQSLIILGRYLTLIRIIEWEELTRRVVRFVCLNGTTGQFFPPQIPTNLMMVCPFPPPPPTAILQGQRRICSSAVGNCHFYFFFSVATAPWLARYSRIFEEILPLFQGNLLYFLSVVVEECLDL